MKDLFATLLVFIIGVTLLAVSPLRGIYSDYKDKQYESDRLSTVTSLINYNQKYGDYPLKGFMKDSTVKDRAQNEIELKIKEGVIKDKGIVASIVEIDISALSSTLNLSKNDRYFMLKDNPYSAFSWRHAKKEGFRLVDKKNLVRLTNIETTLKDLSVGSKKMTSVKTSYQYNNIILVGGSGDFVLGKIVNSKLSIITDASLSNVKSVDVITDQMMKVTYMDNTIGVISLKGVIK